MAAALNAAKSQQPVAFDVRTTTDCGGAMTTTEAFPVEFDVAAPAAVAAMEASDAPHDRMVPAAVTEANAATCDASVVRAANEVAAVVASR